MNQLTQEQLKTLDKNALITIAMAMQNQLDSLTAQLDKANAQIADGNKQIEVLIEQIRVMNQRQFGRHSESGLIDDGQMTLFDSFNEAEVMQDKSVPEPEITEIIIPEHRRSKAKGKREEDLKDFPARIFEHKLSDEELAEQFPNGYKELPEVVTKRLHVIPETFIVDEHHIHVYASKDNDGRIVKAPRPVDLFRGSIATASLVALIINGKYGNALPLDRQSRSFKANGVNLSTNTLANWVIKASEDYFSLIYDKLHESIYDSHIIHADETPTKVMRIDGQKIENGKKTHMWVYRNRPADAHPVVLFDWQPSRRTDHPREFLKHFSGTLVTDGYQVYHTLDNERFDLNVAGCWVHARRPFAEFIKSLKDSSAAKGTIAAEAYSMITEMMHIDNGFDDLSPEDRRKQRQHELLPKVDAYFEFVKHKYAQVTRNSVIGRALGYSINQEKYLRAFLDDGEVPMDNNCAEQAIRPFTIGRKNFVITESDHGAKASAVIYSLVETAKANHLNSYKYFEFLLTEIPKHMKGTDLSFLNDLLPWSAKVQAECPSKYVKP